MSKLEKGIPLLLALAVIAGASGATYENFVKPAIDDKKTYTQELEKTTKTLDDTQKQLKLVEAKVEEMRGQLNSEATKKIYYPSEADLGQESVGFFLYSEVISIAKENNIKIRSIVPNYDIKSDPFLDQGGRSNYYVCDLDMKLISNYKDLRNFVEALYQYEYYIKFNELKITPYETDKKILLTDFSIRLYSHTDVEKVLPPADIDL